MFFLLLSTLYIVVLGHNRLPLVEILSLLYLQEELCGVENVSKASTDNGVSGE